MTRRFREPERVLVGSGLRLTRCSVRVSSSSGFSSQAGRYGRTAKLWCFSPMMTTDVDDL